MIKISKAKSETSVGYIQQSHSYKKSRALLYKPYTQGLCNRARLYISKIGLEHPLHA